MISRNIVNLTISVIALLLILLIALKFCKPAGKLYNQKYIDALVSKIKASEAEYKDSLVFVNGQLELQGNKVESQTERIMILEDGIDSLLAKHEITKKKVNKKNAIGESFEIDSSYVIMVPNEYVDECETCFNKLSTYKQANIALRFERDSYDTLMRVQSDIQANRIGVLEYEKRRQDTMIDFYKHEADIKRKLKLSAMGIANDLFLPIGGGPGLIYEDKKSNEYGAHVVFTTRGKMYLVHIAKTISFRRKK